MSSPTQRNVYGRGVNRNRRDGSMGSVEKKFAEYLNNLKSVGAILRWDFEPCTLRLAKGSTYCPDFRVMQPDGEIIFYEVKGRTTVKRTDDSGAVVARVDKPLFDANSKTKIKIAAELHPHRFFIAWPIRERDGGGFVEEEV